MVRNETTPTGEGAGETWATDVPEGIDHVRAEEERLLDAVRHAGFSEASIFAIRLAFEEAMVNAFKHGGGGDNGVGLEVTVTPALVRLVIDDRGPGFDPDAVPDPLADENLELPSGRGLMLMRQYMTRVAHNPRGNRVTLEYDRPG